MSYEEIVEIIKEVTGLDIPVYYNDLEAMESAYFGISGHEWDIAPEEIRDDPMFEVVDFIENKHIGYYHVGLPEKIIRKGDDYVYKVLQKILDQAGIDINLTETLIEVYVILHEFGHGHQLFVSYDRNVEQYLRDNYQSISMDAYLIRSNHLGGTEEGYWQHKSIPTEQYADSFAVKHFVKVVEALNLAKSVG